MKQTIELTKIDPKIGVRPYTLYSRVAEQDGKVIDMVFKAWRAFDMR